MKHASHRRPRRRRGRVVAATTSALTFVVALLGGAGVLPVDLSPTSVTAEADLAERTRVVADRARRDTSPAPSPRTTTASATPSPRRTSPNPTALPPGSGSGKRIVYALSANRVWLVNERNEVVRTYLVSGTRFNQVRPGTYKVIRKRRYTTSWHGTERMQYMVTFTFGRNAAIGFHDIPVDIKTGKPVQRLDQLGQSLSDGCVRQARPDAKALWDFAPPGTPVIVLA